jgi:hypothetical protein
MTWRFTERLLAGATGQQKYPSVRPALTPEMIPEAYRLPEDGTGPPPATHLRNEPEEAPELTAVEETYETPRVPTVKARERRTEGSQAPPQAAVGEAEASPEAAGTIIRPESGPVVSEAAGIPHGPEAPPPAPATPATQKPPSSAPAERAPKPVQPETRERKREVIREQVPPFRAGSRRREGGGSSEENSVTVHIGRIEVRAVMPEEEPRREAQKPALSLADYLKRREGKASE